jgi:hypothetical protein
MCKGPFFSAQFGTISSSVSGLLKRILNIIMSKSRAAPKQHNDRESIFVAGDQNRMNKKYAIKRAISHTERYLNMINFSRVTAAPE